MVCLTVWAESGEAVVALLAPFLTLSMFSMLIETPVFLTLLARAFLSDAALKRMTVRAREDIKVLINESIADASDDDHIKNLCRTIEDCHIDLLRPYADSPTIEIEHSPYPGSDVEISAVVRQRLQVRNPRTEPSAFEQPFKTTMQVGKTSDQKPAYALKELRVTQDGKTLAELKETDVLVTPEVGSGFTFTVPSVDVVIPGKSSIDVVYISVRVIPFRDIYQYFVRVRPTWQMMVTYDYGELARAHPEIRPAFWLYSRTATAEVVSQFEGKITWRLNGWLVVGDGFAISW